MYKIKMGKADTLEFEGAAVPPPTHPVSIKAGWNWIGYLPKYSKTVSEGLSTLIAADGDYIKNQTRSATFYDGFGWFGELESLEPWDGFMLKSGHAGTLT